MRFGELPVFLTATTWQFPSLCYCHKQAGACMGDLGKAPRSLVIQIKVFKFFGKSQRVLQKNLAPQIEATFVFLSIMVDYTALMHTCIRQASDHCNQMLKKKKNSSDYLLAKACHWQTAEYANG
jgi:hypothetical protein